jgi:hypothetical protein
MILLGIAKMQQLGWLIMQLLLARRCTEAFVVQ